MNNPYPDPRETGAVKGPPVPQPKPGSPEFLNEMIRQRQEAVALAQSQLQTANARIAELQTQDGYQKWLDAYVKQWQQSMYQPAGKDANGKEIPEQVSTGSPLPEDIRKAWQTEINDQRLLQNGASKSLNDNMNAIKAISTGMNPATVAQMNAAANSSTTNARMLYQQQAEREENAANGYGAVTNQQRLANDAQLATQKISLLDKQIDLTKAMSDDELRRTYTIPRQMAVDALNAANTQMSAEDSRQQAALKNDEAVWGTLYQGAMKQYSDDYTNRVAQRSQDLQSATSLAGDAARIVGQIMPHVASNQVMNDVLGPNSTYAKMGGTPQDWLSRPTNLPDMQSLINTPLTTFQAAYAGMPAQVEPGQFSGPGAPPASADYLRPSGAEQYISGLYGQQLPTPQIPQGASWNQVQSQMNQTQQQMAQRPYMPPAPMPAGLNYAAPVTPEQAAMMAQYGGNNPNVGGD